MHGRCKLIRRMIRLLPCCCCLWRRRDSHSRRRLNEVSALNHRKEQRSCISCERNRKGPRVTKASRWVKLRFKSRCWLFCPTRAGEGGFVPAGGGGGGGDDAASFCFSQERRTGVTSGATVVDKAPSPPFWGEFRATLEPGESMVCLVFQLFGARKVASLFFYLFVLVSLFLGFWREKLIVVTSSRRHEGRLVWHRF